MITRLGAPDVWYNGGSALLIFDQADLEIL